MTVDEILSIIFVSTFCLAALIWIIAGVWYILRKD